MRAAGRINNLQLSSRSVLTAALSLADTLNAPMIVPLAERDVQAGERVTVHNANRFGQGFGRFCADYGQPRLPQYRLDDSALKTMCGKRRLFFRGLADTDAAQPGGEVGGRVEIE